MSIISDDNKFTGDSAQKDSKKHSDFHKNPVIKAESIECDKNFENSIRPKSFDAYIGQSALKETLKITIAAAKKRVFYIDGEAVGSKTFRPFTAPPVELCFGGLKTWNGQSLIDEVRILDRVLTPEEVRQDLEGLQTVRTLAENMTWLLHCIEAGKQAGVPYPTYEPRVRTNFIR